MIKSRVIKCPVEILGVDIDKQSIEKAREGIYRKDEMKNVSSQILNDCFKQVGTDYQVKDEIKQYCRFEIHDLFKPLVYDHKSDLILCRNFLIYISTEDQSKVIQNVNTNLKKNGYVMLGITEGFKLMNELEYEIEDIDGRIYKFKGSKDTGNVVDYYDNVNDNNLETHGSQSYSYNYISPKPAAKATTERNKKLNAATTRLEKASDRLMDRLNASTKEKSANVETTNIVGTSTVSEQVKPKEGSFDSKSPSNMVIQESKTVVLNSDRAEDEQDDDTQSGAPQVLTLEEAKKNYNIQESSSSNEAIKVRVSNTLDSHNSGSSIKQTVDTSKINKLRKRLPVRVGRFNDMSEEAKIKQKVKEIKNEKYAEIDRIVEKMKKTEPDSEVNEKSGEVKTRRTQKTEEKNVRLEEPSLPLTAEEVYRRELGIDYILKKQDEEREDIQKIIEKAMAKKTKTKTKTKKKKEK